MKVNGRKIREMAEAMKYLRAVIHIMDPTQMESPTEKVFTNGKMVRSMMESG